MPTGPIDSKQTETSLDNANIAMRTMPWYQDMLRTMGQDPNNVQLNDQQRKQVLTAARANGFDVSNKGMQIDESGNIDKKGHALRNTLIVAGIAGATIATMGAAGVFAGAAGAGAGGLSAGATGVAATLPGAMAAAPAIGGAAAIGGGTTATVGGMSTMAKIAAAAKMANTARSYGSAIGAATSAAGQNRLNQENLSMQGNRDNIAGNAAAENALMNRSAAEGSERRSALVDVARANDSRNQNIGEFNTRGPKVYSQEYTDALTALEQKGLARLKADPSYSTDQMTPLRTYQPLDIKDMQGATGSKASLMERIGQYAGPAMSAYATYKGQPSTRARQQVNDADDEYYGG